LSKVTKASCILLLLSACAAPGPDARADDPFEVHNREVHEANKVLDQAISSGDGGNSVPPELGDAVVNFADNVSLPGMVANNLLQLDLAAAASNTARFLLNSTLGLGGLFDPAHDVGLYEDEASFAQTLAVSTELAWAARAAKLGARVVKRGQYGDTIDSVLYDSADSYEQQRLIYLQNRRFELGVTNPDDAVDPYDDLYGDE